MYCAQITAQVKMVNVSKLFSVTVSVVAKTICLARTAHQNGMITNLMSLTG
jgi:hypothetical protein